MCETVSTIITLWFLLLWSLSVCHFITDFLAPCSLPELLWYPLPWPQVNRLYLLYPFTPGSPDLHDKFCSCLHHRDSVYEVRSLFKHNMKSILRYNESSFAFLHTDITSDRVSAITWVWVNCASLSILSDYLFIYSFIFSK